MTPLQTFARCTLPLLTMGLSVGLTMASLLGCGDTKQTPSEAASSFISVWRLSSENESITLPLRPGYNYNFTVDWGDGASSEITSHDDSDITHTYAESGDHSITISGELEAWYFNNSGSKDKLISVTDLGNMGWINLEGAFEGCSNLRQIGGGDVSNVTNMDRMFKGATSIKKIDFSGWNFALLAKMDETFSEVTLPTGVYNTLLQRLYETSTQENFTLDGGNSKYDSRSENIRQLLKERGWSISDGGFSFFVSVWRTSQASEAIALPLPSGYKYNFTVDWGDDSSSEITSHDDNDITHIYAEAGDYTVTISGTLEAWNFRTEATAHRLKLISVKDLGDVGWRSLKGAFRQCQALEYLSGGNVSGVTDMSSMFGYTESIHLDVGGWDTSKVTDMSNMFERATTANPDVSDWDVSNVTNMSSMFDQAYMADLDVSRWDTSKVTDMSNMFERATTANPDVSDWDVSKVTNMSSMFNRAVVTNPDVSGWDVSNVTDMNYMFFEADVANPDVSGWDVSNVTDMNYMFFGAGVANPDVSGWDVSKVTDMSFMFSSADVANPDVSLWDVSNVTYMESMFSGADVANPDVSDWDVSNVTNMNYMFAYTEAGNPDVSGWDVSNVTNMGGVFIGADVANPDVSLWDVSNVTYMGQMFAGADVANPDVSLWDVSNVTYMGAMFTGAAVANPDVSDWNVSNVTYMSYMFREAPMAQPDMTQWNFLSVTDMSDMLEGLTLPTAIYSSLLNQIHTTSQQNNISFHGGNSKYNSSATNARSVLSGRGWSINDGGFDDGG